MVHKMEIGLGLFLAVLTGSLAFFLKDLAQAFFIGLFVFLHPAIRRGSLIEIGAYKGRIVKIGIKWVTLRDEQGNNWLIDNRLFFKEAIKLRKEGEEHSP